eukprot:1480266-Pyramimonas_sp.AAC.1
MCGGAPGAAAVPMPPQLLRELEKWSVHYPALVGAAREAAPPPAPDARELPDSELNKLAAIAQTELAKKAEYATNHERLAYLEVHWRLDRYNKAKATMEE